MVTDAALGGPAHRAVLHAVAGKAVNVAVVHAHRYAHCQHALGPLDHLARILVQAHDVGCRIKVLHGNVIGICLTHCRKHSYYLLAWAPRLPHPVPFGLANGTGWDASPAFAQAKLVSSTHTSPRAALCSAGRPAAYTGNSHFRYACKFPCAASK